MSYHWYAVNHLKQDVTKLFLRMDAEIDDSSMMMMEPSIAINEVLI